MRSLRSIALLTTVWLVGHMASYAQRSGLSIGLKAAAGNGNWQAAGLTVQPLFSGSMGAYIPFYAFRRLEVQPELLITALGCTQVRKENVMRTYRTAYVQLPVSVKLFVTPIFNIQAGGYAGYLLMAHINDPDGGGDVRDLFSKTDLGVHAGLGADLMNGLDLGVRFSQGMTGIWENDNVVFPMNRWVHGSIGYRFFRMKRTFMNRRRR